MNRYKATGQRVTARIMWLGLAALTGCAGQSWQSAEPLYRCEHGIEFRAKFIDNTAVLDGTRGQQVLFRDAGGLNEKQTVYSTPLMRAEFGLGASGKEAILRYPLLPLVARCVRG